MREIGLRARAAAARRRGAVRAVASADAGAGAGASAADAALLRLASDFGARLHPGLTIGPGLHHGRALVCAAPLPAADTAGPAPRRALVRVPLDLVLSDSLPGCSPAARAAPELAPLLAPGSGAAWELRLAGLLLWAARGGGGGGGGGGSGVELGGGGGGGARVGRERSFWRRYAWLALPPAERQGSLLLWGEEELRELQDEALAAAARRWRAEVCSAHTQFFGGRKGPGGCGGGWRPSLDEWLWATAAVESRAFGVKVDGSEQQCLPPFLDLANHAPGAPTAHGPARCGGGDGGDGGSSSKGSGSSGSSGSGGGRLSDAPEAAAGSHHAGGAGAGWFELRSDAAYGAGEEVAISYGEKSNSELLEQYGFVLEGNPHDRLDLSGLDAFLPQQTAPGAAPQRMPRAALAAAAAAAAARAGEGPAEAARARAAAASLAARLGWRDAREYRASTPASAAACLAAAEACLRAQASGWATSEAEDAAALAALLLGSQGGLPGAARRAAALRFRLERKRLVAAGLEVLRLCGAGG
ncbi:hypothetical protein Rsub_00031 [Raphidocelis subcapitata]|uniref:SET domain-containing protein n=1 Tax=Raphidocelis subcapitata TaxID=307507 RepID=A0A2V0NP93_9CHLO|nr:hypothetical protein Rsub_00031 [Raphidocelis subcapitata]|eukprot:GBF87320.1 hypothetical protein Rsub_00031 [Raphidocelis subcapitata]